MPISSASCISLCQRTSKVTGAGPARMRAGGTGAVDLRGPDGGSRRLPDRLDAEAHVLDPVLAVARALAVAAAVVLLEAPREGLQHPGVDLADAGLERNPQ